MIVVMLMSGIPMLSAQNNESGIWIDPNVSDANKRRSVIMNGNNVESMVGNWGVVGSGPNPVSGVWPKGSGHDHIFEFTGFVAARVIGRDDNEMIVISDGYVDGGGTSGERDPVTNVEWKFHPLPGYFNETEGQDDFANSSNPLSWPETWPGKDATWDGKWNGFFGQNQFNADQEVMYYVDDVWNKEFPFYPFESDSGRRGLGIQIHTRLFQWAHPLAKDILFFYFEISNAGDYDYPLKDRSMYFGGFGDIGPGGRGTRDDDAAFDPIVDMVYGWDHDNIGTWAVSRDIPPGYLGWKFLESPGLDADGIDNDEDGLVDEKRDNDAGEWIFGPVGKYGEPKWHWSGDEDGDWLQKVDDVGSDGIYIYDDGYPGPDADGTEMNGIPDQGEPNFGRLDNDESDQIGLSSFSAPLYGSIEISDEEVVWPRLAPGYFVQPTQTVNQFWLFGSGPVNLPSKKTERFSTSYVFAFTERALFQTAAVAQRIFDADYRFAKPPNQPNLRVIPGDGEVTLIWDDIAELSRDPIYGFDFEGYRIYRATDPQFLDVETVTDTYGNDVFKVPLAQFDLNNGLKGPHPIHLGEEIGQNTGIQYNMGEDTGLQHHYVDKGLINGRTYYYAVTAYDKGYDTDFYERGLTDIENLLPITPAECPASIVVTDGLITRTDPNTAIATPNPIPSDKRAASISSGDSVLQVKGQATGEVKVLIVDGTKITDGDYEISFTTMPGEIEGERQTRSFSVYNSLTDSHVVQDEDLLWVEYEGRFSRNWINELFDSGLILKFTNDYPDENYTAGNSGWAPGSRCNYQLEIGKYAFNSALYPISFVVEFGDTTDVLDSTFTSVVGTRSSPVNFKVYELETNVPIDFYLRDQEYNGRVDLGESIAHCFKEDSTARRYSLSWGITFLEPLDEFGNMLPESEWIAPQPGDKIIVHSKINFSEKDLYTFQTKAEEVRQAAVAENALENIKVVPNPYIVSSILEKRPAFSGRGERFIRFINLPSECTIRIYTVNGDLVQIIQHSSIDQGSAKWDLKSLDNLEVAFGLYVYHVEAPGIGQKIGKFAIVN